MKTFTILQAVRITKRSRTTIARLCAAGKLSALGARQDRNKKTGRLGWVVTAETPEELVTTVHKLVPKGGYRKNVVKKATRKSKGPMKLDEVLAYLEFPDARRALLLDLGARVKDDETLEVLLSLV